MAASAPALQRTHTPATAESTNLNVLRATAVLAVVFSHLSEILKAGGYGITAGIHSDPLGRVGVLLFFVHTSIVLMQSLERSEKRGESLIAGFFVRRGFRIYPLSVFCVTVLLMLHVPRSLTGPFHWPTPLGLIANLALIQNLTNHQSVTLPLWSLPYEVQMYAVMPFLYLSLRKGRGRLAAILFAALIAAPLTGTFSHRIATLFQFAPCFMAGVLAFALSTRGKKAAQLPSWTWTPALLAIAGAYVAAVKVGNVQIWSLSYRAHLLAAGVCTVVGVLIPRFREVSSPALGAFSSNVAKYSYGIYLTHLPVMWFAFVRLNSEPLALRIITFIALFCALPVACFHLIESPMIHIGRNLAQLPYRRS